MRKKTLAVLLIIVVVVAAMFYPVSQNDTITIDATFDNTLLQVIHIDNWKNWYPEIKKAYKENPGEYEINRDSSKKIYTLIVPGEKITVHAITPMAYEVMETGKHSGQNFAFTVFPGENTHQMKIFFSKKVPLLSAIFQKHNGDNPLEGLKNFLETPEQLYGYDIKMGQIRDPIIASIVFKTRQEDIFKRMQSARMQLKDYLQKNSLEKTGYISVSYIPLLHDSIQITVGIPVNKIAPPADGIECLSLPAKGRVLVANYQGSFFNRNKVYAAMTKYLTDHALSIPAESFERYLNDSLPGSDSSEITIELNYPVY